tara:strand:+ start:1429 stop:1605 length:177 start_codon:yes stop_codon:yes gene_type:complete
VFIIVSALVAYLLVLLTVGGGSSAGFNVKQIDAMELWIIYLQVVIIVQILRYLKGKMK